MARRVVDGISRQPYLYSAAAAGAYGGRWDGADRIPRGGIAARNHRARETGGGSCHRSADRGGALLLAVRAWITCARSSSVCGFRAVRRVARQDTRHTHVHAQCELLAQGGGWIGIAVSGSDRVDA